MKTKTFFYSIYSKNNGKTTLNVYRIRHNVPERLGLVELSEARTRGYDSETFNFLINKGYLPKSYYHLSRCDWQGSGYYCPEVEAKGIKIIGV